MDNHLSFWNLITQADIVVQLILIILVIGSIYSWAIMIQRYQIIKSAKSEALVFAREFWSSANLTKKYQQLVAKKDNLTGIHPFFVLH